MGEGMAAVADQGGKLYMPYAQALLAEIEAEMGESALGRIDGALALTRDTGEHWTDSLLHRIRGEILLKLVYRGAFEIANIVAIEPGCLSRLELTGGERRSSEGGRESRRADKPHRRREIHVGRESALSFSGLFC
jgi:hypothetical protein